MATASSPPPDSDHSLHSSPETLTSLPKKPHPLPWTPQETVNLIQAYKEKWYSLNRGQLKASQWEEVAIAVAVRCGFDELSKSSTQCRHKIEKLRNELAAEIRGFAERFMRMEKRKIEMMRDTGRYRIEMEKKRLDMILETQRKIADSVSRILEPNKRVKMEL
nr:trihelix transcription factor ASIL1 [Ipomoea batatas]